jgi:hypothetical protein
MPSKGLDIPSMEANVTHLDQCNPSLCSLDYAVIKYVPNTTANAAFAGIFTGLLALQIIAWYFYRTHSFTFIMCCGLFLEMVGYIARMVIGNDLFVIGPFLVYVCTQIIWRMVTKREIVRPSV